ncbi:HAMP domain-containing sensor histidine kinase [Actinophytocola sp. KF-1]
MRGRIVALAVAAAVLAVALFGVPLAVAVARYYVDDARAALEQAADTASLTVAPALVRGAAPRTLPRVAAGISVAVYRVDGARLAGDGPVTAGVADGLAPGDVLSADTGQEMVLLAAVGDGRRMAGVVRVATPRAGIYRRVVLAWLAMAGLGVVAVGGVWLVARGQARRLARPLEDLSAAAAELGGGDFTVRAPRSGIAEIDLVGGSLDTTAARLSDLVARERAFSAEASHQLRTPLAGLRLQLEAALELPDDELRPSIQDALTRADDLEETVADLLDLARHLPARAGLAPVGDVLAQLVRDRRGLFDDQRRALRVHVPDRVAGRLVAAPVLRQVVSVLLDNALRHGQGTVTVAARGPGSAVAVDVTDEGPGPSGDPFAGMREADHGLGLPLARRLAEAESGRLWLAVAAPPTFTVVLPATVPDLSRSS